TMAGMPQFDPPLTATSIVELLRIRAGTTPGDLAFLFLPNGEAEGPRLTYTELDTQAQAIAAVLRDGAEPGDRALLLYDPGLEFIPGFFGCLYAGLIPVPACPPRLDRFAQSCEALHGIITDCQPRLALSAGDLTR